MSTGAEKSPKKGRSLQLKDQKRAAQQNSKLLDNNLSTPTKHSRENYGYTLSSASKGQVKNIDLWSQDFHPCLEVTRTHHSVSGGHVENNTSLPSLSSQSGVSAGLVGSLNSYPHSTITRNAIPTLGCQWKLSREYALALPHDNETAPLFVHRHGVRRDLLHLKIF